MPSSAHYHTAGIGRGHRQGLQQEEGIGRRWQEHPTMSGSWKVLALGRIAQHPEGAWPAWPPHHPRSPQGAPFCSWVVLILGNSQHPLSSIFCGILKAGAYFWGSSYPLCRAETHGEMGPLPPPEVLSWGSPYEQHYCTRWSGVCGAMPEPPQFPLSNPRQGFGGGPSSSTMGDRDPLATQFS